MLGLGHALTLALSPMGGGTAFVGPLDEYADDAIEVWDIGRRVLTSYTDALIRVRRSSDDTEMDIGYGADGLLDEDSLLSFCGPGDGFVHYIYGQLHGIRMIQDSASAQQRIVNSGVVERSGGLACMTVTGASQGYASDIFSTYTYVTLSAFIRAEMTSTSAAKARMLSTTNGGVDYDLPGANLFANSLYLGGVAAEINGAGAPGIIDPVAVSASTCFVASHILDGSHATIRSVSGEVVADMTASVSVSQVLAAGAYAVGYYNPSMGDKWSSAVVYTTDKTANEAAIRGAMTP